MIESKKKFNYKIIKSSNYKRLTISIKRSHKIIVSAPKRVSNKKINEFILANELWIIENLQKLEKDQKTKKHSYLSGDKFLFYGRLFELEIILNNDDFYKVKKNILKNIIFNQNKDKVILTVHKDISQEDIKNIISELYRQETRNIIDVEFERLTVLREAKPLIAKIKIQKSNGRWGSCSRVNNINFSNRLVMLPIKCIDYVIFHEITHITVKNHKIEFYNKLEEYCPNYKDLEKEILKIERNHNIWLA